jgi:hypothetical protein
MTLGAGSDGPAMVDMIYDAEGKERVYDGTTGVG